MTIACGTCRADPCSCDVQQAPARLINAGDDYAAIAKRETELKTERENLVKMAVLKDQINSELVNETQITGNGIVDLSKPGQPMGGIFDQPPLKLPEGRETQVLGKQSVVVDKATLKGISPNDVYGNLRKRGLLVHMAGGRNSMTLTVGNIRGEKVLVGLFGYGHEADKRLTWDDGLINSFAGVLWDEATTSTENYTHLDTLVAATIARCPGSAIVDVSNDGCMAIKDVTAMLKRNREAREAGQEEPHQYQPDLAAALDDKDDEETFDGLGILRLIEERDAALESNHKLRRDLHEMHMEHLNWLAMMPPNQSDPGDETPENATGGDEDYRGFPQTSAEELRRHTALSHAMELAKAMQRSDTSRILADAKSFEGFLKGE